jgi:rare lipoprotein A (peptidoglycan hydrolase)
VIAPFRCSENFGHDDEFLKGEHMAMTSRQRTLTVLSMGMLFLSTPGQASLEKMKIASHVQRARVVTLKNRMIVSWYGQNFQGRKTASGEIFDQHKLTAAHKTLPLGSRVKLTVVATGRSVIVRINDRGPWIKGRDFDLSEAAAMELGIHEYGVAAVQAAVSEADFAAMMGSRKR